MRYLFYLTISRVFSVWLFFLLVACGSSHKAVKKDVEEVKKDSIRESVNAVHGSNASLVELIKTNGNYTIDFRVYDTDKPVDSVTGTRPVLAEGQAKGDFSKDERKESVTNDSTKVETSKSVVSDTKKNESHEKVKDKKESTTPKQVGWMCIGIAILLVVIMYGKNK